MKQKPIQWTKELVDFMQFARHEALAAMRRNSVMRTLHDKAVREYDAVLRAGEEQVAWNLHAGLMRERTPKGREHEHDGAGGGDHPVA